MTPTDKSSDRHQHPPLGGVRPPRDLQERTKTTLEANGWTMTEFVSACMELVNRNPAGMLGRLTDYRVKTKKGRPSGAGKP